MLSSNSSRKFLRGAILLVGILATITMSLWMLQEAALLSINPVSVVAPEQTVDSITAYMRLSAR